VQEPTRSLLNVSMLVGALRRALKLLASVAPASWLGKTFIAARDGQCYVGARSGNGAVSMMTLIPGASVRSEGLHCFPWDRLGQLAKVVDDRDHVELADGDGIIPSVSAPVLRVESYQRNGIVFKGNMVSASAEGITLPEPTGLDNWSVDAESLVKSLDSAKVAMGENGRQTLDGVLIKADGDGVRVMASDRSQLSHTVLHAFDEGPHGEAFIPSESVKALRVVAVAAGLGNVRFRFEATSIEKPLADGGKTVERFITLSVRTQDVILEIRCDPSHAFPTSRVVGVLTTKTEGLTEFSDVPALTRAVGAACKMIELDANGLKPLTLRSEGRDGHFIVESSAGSVRIGGAENTGPAWSRQFDADILLPYLKSIGKAFPLILENGATSSDPVRFSGAVGVHWICGMADPKPRVAKADPKPSVSVKVAAMGPAESPEVKPVKPKRTARVKADPIAPIIAHVLFVDAVRKLGTFTAAWERPSGFSSRTSTNRTTWSSRSSPPSSSTSPRGSAGSRKRTRSSASSDLCVSRLARLLPPALRRPARCRGRGHDVQLPQTLGSGPVAGRAGRDRRREGCPLQPDRLHAPLPRRRRVDRVDRDGMVRARQADRQRADRGDPPGSALGIPPLARRRTDPAARSDAF
jgi:hypothetical protein